MFKQTSCVIVLQNTYVWRELLSDLMSGSAFLPCGFNLGPLQVLVRVALRVLPEEAFRFHREYTLPRKWVEKIILQKRKGEKKKKENWRINKPF